MRRGTLLIFLTLATTVLVVLPGCMPGGRSSGPADPAGFFMGVWHGWIAPVSLIVGFFNPEIRIYELANKGWSYDLGFYMAIIAGFGGLSLLRKRRKPGG